MVLSFLNLEILEKGICDLDPQIFPDANERKELYLTNRNNLRSITDLLVVYFIMNIFFDFPYSAHIFWVSFCGLHLILLMVFWRTRASIWHWVYTLTLTASQVLLGILVPSSFIYGIGACFISPIFVLQITNNTSHLLINFIFQFGLLHLQYKPALLEALIDDPKVFFADFVNTTSLILIATTTTSSLRFKFLQDIHKSLKTSRQTAEQAYSQLSVFLQTFSHELRNPLNSLLGNLELTLHENLAPSVREMIETAKVCAEVLLQLINNILDTSKVEVTKLDVNPTPTRVIDFVASIWRISRDLIKRKKLNGYLKIDRHIPPILNLDIYRVNQILLNLISNAIKFTERGQIWLKFAWLSGEKLSERCFLPYPYDEDGVFEKEHNMRAIFRSTSESDHLVYLESSADSLRDLYPNMPLHEEHGILKIIIRDTGCGMEKEKLSLLFKKFSQVSDNPSHRKVGTGLGLYITKEICETMGGQIRAYTKQNAGTTFIVCLPTYCPLQIKNTISLKEVIDRLKLLTLQALIFDHNNFNQDLLSNYMLKIGGNVIFQAQDEYEGYKKYKEIKNSKKKVNLIFIDIDPPSTDGISMCAQIREYETSAHIPPAKIVFVCGNYEDNQVYELLSVNGRYRGQSVLKKPVSFETFVNTLGNMNL